MMEMLKKHLKKNISQPKDLLCKEAVECGKKFVAWMQDFKLQAAGSEDKSSKRKTKKVPKKTSAKQKAKSKKGSSMKAKPKSKAKVKKTNAKKSDRSKNHTSIDSFHLRPQDESDLRHGSPAFHWEHFEATRWQRGKKKGHVAVCVCVPLFDSGFILGFI